MRKAYAENPEKFRQRRKQWAADHPDKNREFHREGMRKWRAKNAERALQAARASMRKWRREHPEEAKLRDKQNTWKRTPECREGTRRNSSKHYQANKQQILERTAQWQKDHPIQVREIRAKYRAAHLDEIRNEDRIAHYRRRTAPIPLPGHHTADDIRALLQTQSGLCAACHATLIATGKGKYHVDHIVPLKPRKGDPAGTNDPSNLQLLCPTCNHSKHNLSPAKWAERLKRLPAESPGTSGKSRDRRP